MTWEIALGLFAIVGFVATIIGWSTQISGTLSKLNTSVDALNHTVEKFEKSSDKIHENLSGRISEHDAILAEHKVELTKCDERIKNLENIR